MIQLCLCPLSPELQALAKALVIQGLKFESPDPLDHQLFYFPDLRLYLGKAGLGSSRFQKNASFYLEKIKPNLLICAGGACGLTNKLNTGDIVVQSLNRQILESFSIDSIQYKGTNSILTYDGIVNSLELANELHSDTGAVAVANEGRGGQDAAAIFGIPFVEIRGITDSPFFNHTRPLQDVFEAALPTVMGNIAVVLVGKQN